MGERGLKWAWLFKMETFSPWNLLLLTAAVCSVTLLNSRLVWDLKWAGRIWRLCWVQNLGRDPRQVSACSYQTECEKSLTWHMTYFSPLALQPLYDLPLLKKGSREGWKGEGGGLLKIAECMHWYCNINEHKGCRVEWSLYRDVSVCFWQNAFRHVQSC